MGAASPAATARSRSTALSACKAWTLARSRAARARSARLRVAVSERAISAEACRACRPSVCMYSATFSAFMGPIIPSPIGAALGWGH